MKKIKENIKTIFYALVIALIIRSLLFQPFYIPSSSMEPTLLVGDRLFVSKYSYGYSRHSLPFSPKIFKNRIFSNKPARGDVIVFKNPQDNRDFIKRLIGLPGDTIQIIDGNLYLNNNKVNNTKSEMVRNITCGNQTLEVNFFEEIISNDKIYLTAYAKEGSMLYSDKYFVPDNHYFFMGDNRDCSSDSRFLSNVGYVNFSNLVGRAEYIFFSNDKNIGSFFKFWKWNKSIRFDRLFKKIK